MNSVSDFITAAAALVTAIGVLVAIGQLIVTRGVAQDEFESGLAREYRAIVSRLPTEALLGEALSPGRQNKSFDELYWYLDLTNEQIYLRQRRRISSRVWLDWRAGIQANLERPAFAHAWNEVKARSDSFEELRRLEREKFSTDPAAWDARVSWWRRLGLFAR